MAAPRGLGPSGNGAVLSRRGEGPERPRAPGRPAPADGPSVGRTGGHPVRQRPPSASDHARVQDTEARIVERAIAWALAQAGSTSYALRCLSFVEDAYEVPNAIEVFGGASARESADRYGVEVSTGAAPRGAFVFFATDGVVDGEPCDWGHVGLALGDGRIVHPWPEVRVDAIDDVPRLPAGTWSTPRYRGWAAPAVVLAGARPRA